jgi:hypothetical protein
MMESSRRMSPADHAASYSCPGGGGGGVGRQHGAARGPPPARRAARRRPHRRAEGRPHGPPPRRPRTWRARCSIRSRGSAAAGAGAAARVRRGSGGGARQPRKAGARPAAAGPVARARRCAAADPPGNMPPRRMRPLGGALVGVGHAARSTRSMPADGGVVGAAGENFQDVEGPNNAIRRGGAGGLWRPLVAVSGHDVESRLDPRQHPPPSRPRTLQSRAHPPGHSHATPAPRFPRARTRRAPPDHACRALPSRRPPRSATEARAAGPAGPAFRPCSSGPP